MPAPLTVWGRYIVAVYVAFSLVACLRHAWWRQRGVSAVAADVTSTIQLEQYGISDLPAHHREVCFGCSIHRVGSVHFDVFSLHLRSGNVVIECRRLRRHGMAGSCDVFHSGQWIGLSVT